MKKILAVLLAAVMAIAFLGCNKKQLKEPDVNAAADALNSGLKFGEMLEKSEAEVAFSAYGIDSSLCNDAAFYVGSGATADEIAVFSCVNEEARESVAQAIQSRIDYLHDGYSDYGPEQVPKIDSAAVITIGNTLIMCICDNPEEAEAIVNSVAK